MEEEIKNQLTKEKIKHRPFYLTQKPGGVITKKEIIIVIGVWMFLVILGFFKKLFLFTDLDFILFLVFIMVAPALWFGILISKIITEKSSIKIFFYILLLIVTAFIFWEIVFGPTFCCGGRF